MPRVHDAFNRQGPAWTSPRAARLLHRQFSIEVPRSHLGDYIGTMLRLALLIALGGAGTWALRALM